MKKKVQTTKDDFKDDQAFAFLAELIAEQVDVASRQAEDPFDQYAYNLQAKVFKSSDSLKSRFIQGYHTLLQEIDRTKNN